MEFISVCRSVCHTIVRSSEQPNFILNEYYTLAISDGRKPSSFILFPSLFKFQVEILSLLTNLRLSKYSHIGDLKFQNIFASELSTVLQPHSTPKGNVRHRFLLPALEFDFFLLETLKHSATSFNLLELLRVDSKILWIWSSKNVA